MLRRATSFNGDVSTWDVRSTQETSWTSWYEHNNSGLACMSQDAAFNGDLRAWNTWHGFSVLLCGGEAGIFDRLLLPDKVSNNYFIMKYEVVPIAGKDRYDRFMLEDGLRHAFMERVCEWSCFPGQCMGHIINETELESCLYFQGRSREISG